MPFGKFLGLPLHKLPDYYIEWLTGLRLRDPLRAHLAVEVARRRQGGEPESTGPNVLPFSSEPTA
jgi:hypothetical protein